MYILYLTQVVTFPRKSPNVFSALCNGLAMPEFFVLRKITHVPSVPLNILSWSALNTANAQFQLIEETDGSLVGRWRARNNIIFRFGLEGGLYFLVRNHRKGRKAVLPAFTR